MKTVYTPMGSGCSRLGLGLGLGYAPYRAAAAAHGKHCRLTMVVPRHTCCTVRLAAVISSLKAEQRASSAVSMASRSPKSSQRGGLRAAWLGLGLA
eukprot:scaffold109188_cov63-Phaeocystis_antarctica.AAC.1